MINDVGLLGWFAVADEDEDTEVRKCVGFVSIGDATLCVIRSEKTGICDLVSSSGVYSYDWFRPEDRSFADARAKQIVEASLK